MSLYDHASYVQKIYDDEQAARDFAERFQSTGLAQRHESMRAEREGQAASLAANGPALKAAVDQLLKDSPGLPLEVAYRTAGKRAGIL